MDKEYRITDDIQAFQMFEIFMGVENNSNFYLSISRKYLL